jgi:hypothetical protein
MNRKKVADERTVYGDQGRTATNEASRHAHVGRVIRGTRHVAHRNDRIGGGYPKSNCTKSRGVLQTTQFLQ